MEKPFTRNEYMKRMERVKQRMMEKGLDALITMNPANMNYLSGYDGHSFYVPQAVMVFLSEDEPVWAGRAMDASGARFTTWLKDENIRGYDDDYVQSDVKHPVQFFADVMREKRVDQKRIGVEMNQDFFLHRSYVELIRALPQASLVDVSYMINRIRMIKSEQEITYMKQAAQITDLAITAAVNKIAAGVRESDVAADVYHALVRGTGEFCGDYPAIPPLMPSEDKTSTPHLSWSDRIYQNNEIVHLELSGCRLRYHAPLARTVFTGKPPQRYMDMVKTVIEGLHAMLDVIRAGMTCEEVEQTWREVIRKAGIEKESRVGYPVGLGYPPDWGEQTVSMRPGDITVLEPNMTFHVLPALWMEPYSFIISETVRVTEQGCETFSSLPRELFVR